MTASFTQMCEELGVSKDVQAKLKEMGVSSGVVLANQFKSEEKLDGFIVAISQKLPEELYGCEPDASPLAAKLRGLYKRAVQAESKVTSQAKAQPANLAGPVQGAQAAQGRSLKVDAQKRAELEKQFHARGGVAWGSERVSPGNKTLALFGEMAGPGDVKSSQDQPQKTSSLR